METTNFATNRRDLQLFVNHIHGIESSSQQKQALIYLRQRLWNGAALCAGDIAALTLALFVAGAARWLWYGAPMIPSWSWLLVLAWITVAFAAQLLPSWGIGMTEELRRVVLILIAVYAGVAVTLFLQKQGHEVSRFVVLAGFFLSVALVLIFRAVVKKMLAAFNLWGVPTVIYGDAETSERVIQALNENKNFGYIPVGVFNKFHGDETHINNVPVLGSLNETTARAPVAILAIPGLRRENMVELLDGPLSQYRHVMIIPNLFEVQSLWVKTRDVGGILGLEVSRNLLDPVAWLTKLSLEILLVAVTAVFWIPLCLLLALIIWLESRATPFFMQERIGKDGLRFKTCKFRTMVPNAERVLAEKLERDPELNAEWQANFKLKNDPRVTFVGKFLRKTSLDELPQLINVLRGEMSLVGPRPLPAYHHDELNNQTKTLRERVRPGLTGLWQVSGRSDTGTAGMQKWDTYYVRNWSVWLDFVIIARTFKTVVKGSGAY